ncbi:hypothetical protein SCOCK_120220 [Actinacidiphila cocklensis]|uniref:Uncharacterized protein n=1 Tax=Actinacidiphila cocklensis TaxID=887465 RepID=A0A9W4DJZ4_9ACTN|nr:hypothetical protein SCOCK_120220 [Actinacidiphila cocklensis]
MGHIPQRWAGGGLHGRRDTPGPSGDPSGFSEEPLSGRRIAALASRRAWRCGIRGPRPRASAPRWWHRGHR